MQSNFSNVLFFISQLTSVTLLTDNLQQRIILMGKTIINACKGLGSVIFRIERHSALAQLQCWGFSWKMQ